MQLEIQGSKIRVAADFANFKEFLDQFNLQSKLYIVTDKNVYGLYKNLLETYFSTKPHFIVLDSGEETKNINNVLDICTNLLEAGIRRNDYLIGFGGGVICDMTGFIASILYRGIPHLLIPTTLLADIDASVGGKTGVDFFGRKNILGSFYPPRGIYIATNLLETLPKTEVESGYGELFKYAFLKQDFYELLVQKPDLTKTIAESLAIKKYYVETDFCDQGLRMMLNLGHTFGHLVELEANLAHGIAVIAGMKMIFDLEESLGLIDNSFTKKLEALCRLFNIPLENFFYKDYLAGIFTDKKNLQGKLHLIFVNENGPFIYETTREDLYAKIKND